MAEYIVKHATTDKCGAWHGDPTSGSVFHITAFCLFPNYYHPGGGWNAERRIKMDSYIDKMDAVRTVTERICYAFDLPISAVISICKDAVADIPAADVVPVVHGHWIRHDDADIIEGYYVPKYECFECGAWKEDDSDFCPDCGARMYKE